jgi:hypothetical protein
MRSRCDNPLEIGGVSLKQGRQRLREAVLGHAVPDGVLGLWSSVSGLAHERRFAGKGHPPQSISGSSHASSSVSEMIKLRVRKLLAIFPCGLFKPALERSVR